MDDFVKLNPEERRIFFEGRETAVQHKTYTPKEVAAEMYRRLEEAQDPDDPDLRMRTIYTDKFPVEPLEKVVKASLARLK